jgi:peptidoglycan/xylan/chitin deacetylase (PgdA/CDA1 family)
VARHAPHRGEDPGVADAARLDLRPDHLLALGAPGVATGGNASGALVRQVRRPCHRAAEQNDQKQAVSHGDRLLRSYVRMLWILLIGAALKALSHTAPFPFVLEKFAPAQALWRMPAGEPPTIYLTFDDGPNPAATPELLDVLRRHGATATFFLIDQHLTEATAPIVRRMAEEGHGVAIHSNTRALMLKTPEDFARFLESTADRVERLAGVRPCRLFRPHAGWRGGSMYAGAARAGYRIVGWGWGLWDWNWYRARNADTIAARLIERASPGDIIVLHDGHHRDPSADRQYAVDAVAELVPALRARGLAFGNLCAAASGSDPVRRQDRADLRGVE